MTMQYFQTLPSVVIQLFVYIYGT